MNKKLIASLICVLFFGLSFTPAHANSDRYASSLGFSIDSQNSDYEVRSYSDDMELIYVDSAGQENGFVFVATDTINSDFLDYFVYYTTIAEFGCYNMETVFIGGDEGVRFTCDSEQMHQEFMSMHDIYNRVSQLPNDIGTYTMSFFTIDDQLYVVVTYGGNNNSDSELITQMYNSLIFGHDSQYAPQRSVTSEYPLITITSDNPEWSLFTSPVDSYYQRAQSIYGINTADPTRMLLVERLYGSLERRLPTDDYLYFRGLRIPESGIYRGAQIELIEKRDDFVINDNYRDVIKMVYRLNSTLDTNINLYLVGYVIRFKDYTHPDVFIGHGFIESDGSAYERTIADFENNVLRNVDIVITQHSNIDPPYIDILEGRQPGQLVKGESNSAVYLIDYKGLRYVFPNQAVYNSWYDDFDEVSTWSDASIAEHQLVGNVTFRPGSLMKIPSDPRVYVVSRGNRYRWITSEQDAARMFGNNWALQVHDTSEAYLIDYTEDQFRRGFGI